MSKRNALLLAISFILLTIPSSAPAQKWTPQQQEVWAAVQEMLKPWSAKDAEGFAKCFDKRCVAWIYTWPVPIRGEDAEEWYKFYLQGEPSKPYKATPSHIEIHGDVAVATYYLSSGSKDPTGAPQEMHERYMLVLLKKSGKWSIIAFHGGLVEVK
jgi:uncharacterized protein (TIGR02246 family)